VCALKKTTIKHKKLTVIFGIAVLVFLLLFIFNKEFRFNTALRVIVLTNSNPACERVYSIDVWEDNIYIKKKIYSNEKLYKENYKAALISSLIMNEKIYKLQRSDFWCNDIKAVYIDSDTYLKGGLSKISVQTGYGHYDMGASTVCSEGKLATIRYQDPEFTEECEKIVSEYDDYDFFRE